MPKVGKHYLSIKGSQQQFEVWYNSKEGFYYKDFPEEMGKVVSSADPENRWSNSFSTEGDLKLRTQLMINRYYEITKTERHVIIIRMAVATGMYMNRVEGYKGSMSYQGYKDWARPHKDFLSDSSFNSLEHALGFEYETGVIVSAGKDSFFRTVQNEDGKIVKKADYGHSMSGEKYTKAKVLNYSRELELFLEGVSEQMERLAAKMVGFFNDETKLLAAAQDKTKLLGQ